MAMYKTNERYPQTNDLLLTYGWNFSHENPPQGIGHTIVNDVYIFSLTKVILINLMFHGCGGSLVFTFQIKM